MTNKVEQKRRPDAVMLRERELADRWNMSPRTLQRWRADGEGPPWHLFKGAVRYLIDDVRAFEAGIRQGSVD